MKIVSALYLGSAFAASQFPPPFLPEIAFLGKSNVGKSSVINALLGRKNLAKISATPGKTRSINFFLVNQRFRFVDLPGYGFAQVSSSERAGWRKLCEGYLRGRACLRGAVMIVDMRHVPGPLDQEMKAWLDHVRVPALIVANKADKLTRAQVPTHLAAVAETLPGAEAPLAFSAKSKSGRDALWARLAPWLAVDS
jgi:GTP-binding protein